jgi:hypothetical protein
MSYCPPGVFSGLNVLCCSPQEPYCKKNWEFIPGRIAARRAAPFVVDSYYAPLPGFCSNCNYPKVCDEAFRELAIERVAMVENFIWQESQP